MDRDRGSVLQSGGSTAILGSWGTAALAEFPVVEAPAIVPASRSTPLLRRCTALATRARVDLLITSRPADCVELIEVLAELSDWEDAQLVDPDPTMLALAAAALQDLRERLDETRLIALGPSITDALRVLHAELS